MEGWDLVTALMADIASVLKPADVMEDLDQGVWMLSFAGGLSISVSCAPAADRIVIQAPLGRPEPGLRSPTYEMLLAYTASAAETGGGSVALFDGEGEPHLRHAVSVSGLDIEQMRGLVHGFLTVACSLRTLVGRAGPDIPAATDLDPPHFQMIRG